MLCTTVTTYISEVTHRIYRLFLMLQFTAKSFYNKTYRPRWVAPNAAEDSDIEVEDDEDNTEVYNDNEDIPQEEIQSVEPLRSRLVNVKVRQI